MADGRHGGDRRQRRRTEGVRAAPSRRTRLHRPAVPVPTGPSTSAPSIGRFETIDTLAADPDGSARQPSEESRYAFVLVDRDPIIEAPSAVLQEHDHLDLLEEVLSEVLLESDGHPTRAGPGHRDDPRVLRIAGRRDPVRGIPRVERPRRADRGVQRLQPIQHLRPALVTSLVRLDLPGLALLLVAA